MNVIHTTITGVMEFQAPATPMEAEKYIPQDIESFGDGLWHVFKTVVAELSPSLKEAAGICVCLIAIVLLISVFQSLSGMTKDVVQLCGTVCVAIALISPSNALINLGIDTIKQISDYGKLLLPVMTASLAAQGGITTSGSLYAGTMVFNTILSSVLVSLFVPAIYIYIVMSIANSAIGNEMLKNITKFTKWLLTWILKLSIYIFTGYIGITGVVSGAVDASTLKAAKIAISGAVPVIGNIVSDASEAILVSAGVVKNSVGVVGILTIFSLWLGPFFKIAIQYLLLKATSAFCGAFGHKETCGMISGFAGAMGFVLAATSVISLLFFISIVCFMRGVF